MIGRNAVRKIKYEQVKSYYIFLYIYFTAYFYINTSLFSFSYTYHTHTPNFYTLLLISVLSRVQPFASHLLIPSSSSLHASPFTNFTNMVQAIHKLETLHALLSFVLSYSFSHSSPFIHTARHPTICEWCLCPFETSYTLLPSSFFHSLYSFVHVTFVSLRSKFLGRSLYFIQLFNLLCSPSYCLPLFFLLW